MKYRYRVYGLKLEAEEALPGLKAETEVCGEPDVRLQLGGEPGWVCHAQSLKAHRLHQLRGEPEKEEPALTLTCYGDGGYFGLSYTDGTRFVVDSVGRQLWGTWVPPWTLEDFATYLLGPVLGFVLRRRRVLPLHASAVCLADRAIIICGDAQAGKSTTAAALALRGMPVLCEDIAALKLLGSDFWVEPGYPRVCLWPDSVEKLLGRADALPLLTPNWEKRYLPLDGKQARFQRERSAVRAVYLLAPRDSNEGAPRAEAMTPQAALLALVQNTYMNWLPGREQKAREFDALTRLVGQVPVRRLVGRNAGNHIDELCEVILEDAESLPPSAALQMHFS